MSTRRSLDNTRDAPVLGGLDGGAFAELLQAASDLTLVLDAQGTIRDILGVEAHLDESRGWIGRAWVDTVAPEGRDDVRDLLHEAASAGVSSRRQVNQVGPEGEEIPVAYAVFRLGAGPDLVAVGRDMRGMAVVQQRLGEAQQALERDYWRMRQLETRHHLLFQLSSEPVLVVDVATLKILEANPAAGRLFALAPRRLIGHTFPLDLARESEPVVEELLAHARASGRSEERAVRLESQPLELRIGVSLVRYGHAPLFLVRLVPLQQGGFPDAKTAQLHEVVREMPDAFLLADPLGVVQLANRAFCDLAQLATTDEARGQPGGRWLGRPGAGLEVLLATLREHRVVRLFSTSLRGELGSVTEVEVSAIMTPPDAEPCVGMIIRDVSRRLASGPHGARDLTRAVEQLTDLLGRVALKDLVRDTTALVERHFIEAALELTGFNRTSAAEVLGVSRQTLYMKLRRYQLLVPQRGTTSGKRP